jgi:hypothetical protein
MTRKVGAAELCIPLHDSMSSCHGMYAPSVGELANLVGGRFAGAAPAKRPSCSSPSVPQSKTFAASQMITNIAREQRSHRGRRKMG